MNAIVREKADLTGAPLDPRYPSRHEQKATVRRDKPLNLVIILQESQGAQYADNFGYLQGDRLRVLEPSKVPREFRYRAGRPGRGLEQGGVGTRPVGQLGLPRGKIPLALISPHPGTGLV